MPRFGFLILFPYTFLFFLSFSLEDHNECLNPAHHSCDQTCHNIPGSYFCSCLIGYDLLDDGYSCLGESRSHGHLRFILYLFSSYACVWYLHIYMYVHAYLNIGRWNLHGKLALHYIQHSLGGLDLWGHFSMSPYLHVWVVHRWLLKFESASFVGSQHRTYFQVE